MNADHRAPRGADEPALPTELTLAGLAGDAGLSGLAGLGGEATLAGDVTLWGEATLAGLSGLAGLGGEATLAGDVTLWGEATLAGDATLWDEATLAGLAGDAMVVDVVSVRAGVGRAVESPGIEVVVGACSGDDTDRLWSRTTPSGRTVGSSAPAMANPPIPTPTSAPLTAATFQLIRDFCM